MEQTSAMKTPNRKSKFRMAIWIALFIIASVFVVLATQVNDWSRDLTQNEAEIGPIALDESVESVRSRVLAWTTSKPNWSEAPREDDDHGKVHLVRTTKVWRFADDIHVTILPSQTGVSVTATSKSRLGKGDLGQNPRNLLELRDCLLDNETELSPR